MYAAGKIPGGYIKREGRPPEHAVLSSRQIDRPIRPLFPEGFQNDVQVVATVMSVDPELDPDVLGICSAGAALALSDIPFDGPVAGVRVGRDENGKFIANPTLPQYVTGGMEIVVAGTADAIMMVEGGADEISEEDFLGAVEFAHGEIKKIVKAINQLVKKAGKDKREYPLKKVNADLDKWVRKTFAKDVAKAMRIVDKHTREAAFSDINVAEALERVGKKDDNVKALLENSDTAKEFGKIVKGMEEDELRVMVVDEKIRSDGPSPTKSDRFGARCITCRASTVRACLRADKRRSLPQRRSGRPATLSGSTVSSRSKKALYALLQLPAVLGRGSSPDARAGSTRSRSWRPCRARASPVIPLEDPEFPYTLLLISEVLESNGSTSMASVCGSSLALMDAGIQIKAPVAGIAMGLMSDGKATRF